MEKYFDTRVKLGPTFWHHFWPESGKEAPAEKAELEVEGPEVVGDRRGG